MKNYLYFWSNPLPIPPVSSLERPHKILVAMLELSPDGPVPLKYEDIVVKAFLLFPDEFALRGYPQYPDSSDIHKPLYGPLKRAGFVRNANKTFALTELGVEQATKLRSIGGRTPSKPQGADAGRLSRSAESELVRIKESPAFRFFCTEQSDSILDTDFYAILGCTVRTPNNDFLSRFNSVGSAVNEAVAKQKPSPAEAEAFRRLWAFLKERFNENIQRRQPARTK